MPPQSGRCVPCPAARSAGPQEAAEDAAPVSVPGCWQGPVPIPPATGEESERAYQSARSSAREKLSKTDNNTERTRNPPPRKDGSNGPAFHEEKGNDSCGAAAPVHNQCRSSVAPSAGKPFAAGYSASAVHSVHRRRKPFPAHAPGIPAKKRRQAGIRPAPPVPARTAS